MTSTTDAAQRPVVVGSVFKSGTWLLRRLVTALTGLKPVEPEIRPGNLDPRDPRHLRFVPGRFFSWHFTPTAEIGALLQQHRARVVFLLRNPYDLVVSMYHHFRDDIDGDIGRSAGQADYFARFDRNEGLRRIILPGTTRQFPWPGIGEHLEQMEAMLAYAAQQSCLVTTYERLQSDRAGEIRRLADFLDARCEDRRVTELCELTRIGRMRAAAQATGQGSHFRQGLVGAHADVLKPEHVALLDAALARHAPRFVPLARQAGLDELLQCAVPVSEPDTAPCA